MTKDQINGLLKEYLQGNLSGEGEQQLKQALKDGNETEFREALENMMAENTDGPEWRDTRMEQMVRGILDADKNNGAIVRHMPVRRTWARFAAAAAIIIILTVSVILSLTKYANDKDRSFTAAKDAKTHDVAPGKHGAVLTLTNGKTIILDTAQNGKLLDNFTKSGESLTVESSEMEYATLTTPKARTQQLILSDGSKVWLNAASSIHFPTVFKGKERVVEITGEAYFEVVHNDRMPFRVKVGTEVIEDLGTEFNINAYSDEPSMKTTLLSGAIKMREIILKPGQQAVILNGQLTTKNNINLKQVVAWKDDLFRFESEDIETIMRQLSRWYDVDVIYKTKSDKHFTGVISRNVNASEVFKMLEMTGEMHFIIEGREVIVDK